MAFSIRDGDVARDRSAMLAFILGLQHFEYAIAPNRRLDPAVAEDHLAKLLRDAAARPARFVMADDAQGAPIGWAVVQDTLDAVFVEESQRRYAYVAELFVVEAARGTGVGRALIAACEDWARAQGIGLLQIGVLAGNERAKAVYVRAGFRPYAIELRKQL